MNALFGILVQERYQLQLADFWGLVQSWLQDAGGFAAVGLVLWIAYRLSSSTSLESRGERRISSFMILMAILTAGLYIAAGVVLGIELTRENPNLPPPVSVDRPVWQGDTLSLLLTAAGLTAILGLLEPLVSDLFRLRWRRIWALASISFKEAVRRKVVWVFLVFLLVFLFPAKWFFDIKAEDEVRTTVSVIHFAMTALLVLPFGILAAFSIPNDVRSQAIHTIVTKPVERFEIVLGRFFGFTGLMTLVLLVLTAFSLLLIAASSPDPLAEEESLKARKPIYGLLSFKSLKQGEDFQGVSVGREWEYRRYIAGGPRTPQRAVWNFYALPSELATRTREQNGQTVPGAVPCEFAFDIFRTTKGERESGVLVTFTVTTWQWGGTQERLAYEEAARADNLYQVNVRPDDPRWSELNQLAEKFGYYQFRSKLVEDYHTLAIDIPPGIFANALERDPPTDRDGNPMPLVKVEVKLESPSQFLGVAPPDLYLLQSEGSFYVNFLKGSFGLWCRLCIIIGIAVAVSTYLNGVISLLLTLMLFLSGLFRDYIVALANNRSVGGGPFESATRLLSGKNMTIDLDPSPLAQVSQVSDEVWRWTARRVINVIPDVDRFTWTSFLSEGFNVPLESLLLNLIMLMAYLLPWGLLGYYLIKTREVATW